MIEPIMYIGIGFLFAGLLVIGVIPLVHARAVRLTRRRLEAVTPMSLAEIQAEKDQLRAEFAMTTRRLEMNVEEMKAKTNNQLAEIGKKSEAIAKLRLELNEKTETMYALEAREKELIEEIANTRVELADRTAALANTEQTLVGAKEQIGELSGKVSDTSQTATSQRVELVALRAHVEALQGQIEAYEMEAKDLNARLSAKSSEAEASSRLLGDERTRSDVLSNRISELERHLLAQTTEAEILERRVQELNARVDEQSRLLRERDYAAEQLRTETTDAARKEADTRAQFTEAEHLSKATIERQRAEKTLLESQLKRAEEERARLTRELETMRREAETAFANERKENAVMRERIAELAAEMARITSLIEGPGNPIEAILAESARAAAANGAGGNGAVATPGTGEGSLTDRIRALQTRPRVAAASRA
jgi:predicted RNase H-like nuclease (RuvC/YqgF family)